jgi:flagellin
MPLRHSGENPACPDIFHPRDITMTSLNTNVAAMTALQTLAQTNKAMEGVQNRISTGFRVSNASDNAAYWSIATTMRSDNKALGAVQDSLGLGAATIDVAYTAMNSTVKVVDEIKAKLVAARTPGVDRGKIQSEITELQKQLRNTAESAVFNGENWLAVDSGPTTYNPFKTIVASFARTGGAISIDTVDVSLNSIKLLDANTEVAAGSVVTQAPATAQMAIAAGAGNGWNVAAATTLTVNGVTLNVAAGSTQQDVANQISNIPNLTAAVDSNGLLRVASRGSTGVTFGAITAGAFGAGVTFTNVAAPTGTAIPAASRKGILDKTFDVFNSTTNTWGTASILSIDIRAITDSSADLGRLEVMIRGVDKGLEAITDAATNLGSLKARIGLQQDFVKALRDSMDRGIGQLVDADMSAESTRLQALQTQQQLGIQALSIANAGSQNILSLFRG